MTNDQFRLIAKTSSGLLEKARAQQHSSSAASCDEILPRTQSPRDRFDPLPVDASSRFPLRQL